MSVLQPGRRRPSNRRLARLLWLIAIVLAAALLTILAVR
jgi:hypothetical protein